MKTLEQILSEYGLDIEYNPEFYEELKESQKNYAKEALKNASDGLVEWSYEKYPNFRTAREHIISEYNLPKHQRL